MRALIIAVVVLAAAVAGFLVYRGGSPSAPAPTDAATVTASAPTELHTNCEVQYAVYQYNEDVRVRLFFRRVPATAAPDLSNREGGRQIGNMMFVVSLASINKEYVFTPVNRMASGPAYESYVLYVRPQSGSGGQMPVQLFNSEMHIISDMPRNDSEAPRYIIMPDLMRRLYVDRIDMPTGAFRFFRCEPPAAATTTP